MMTLVSILARRATENRIDGKTKKRVASWDEFLFEGEDITMKRIGLQHGVRDWGLSSELECVE